MTLTDTIKQTKKMNRQDFKKLFFCMLQTADTKYKNSHFLEDFMINKNLLGEYGFEKEDEKTSNSSKNNFKEALDKIQKYSTFDRITDPILWQNKQRDDR